ncbi:hypothetical protein [Thiomicrorhabdus indica]|uniref:hypothetical protein n=1 Tax=Thiomicrorhabdus indica TaxID=2267253 RepID=UPI002AA947CC|nr:hypothetical protein [Thiomicrorhabdus indica]
MPEHPTEHLLNSSDKEMNEMLSDLLSAFPELTKHNDSAFSDTRPTELRVEEIMKLPKEKLSKFNRFLRKLIQFYSVEEILQAEQILLTKHQENPHQIESYYGKLRAHELQLLQTDQLCKEEFESHWQKILLHEINRSIT